MEAQISKRINQKKDGDFGNKNNDANLQKNVNTIKTESSGKDGTELNGYSDTSFAEDNKFTEYQDFKKKTQKIGAEVLKKIIQKSPEIIFKKIEKLKTLEMKSQEKQNQSLSKKSDNESSQKLKINKNRNEYEFPEEKKRIISEILIESPKSKNQTMENKLEKIKDQIEI